MNGAAKAPPIHDETAGISVDGPEQGADRVESSDDENRRPERLEIFRDEAHPQFLARTDREDSNEQDDEVAAQGEKFRERAPVFH